MSNIRLYTHELIDRIASAEVQQFIRDNEHTDVQQLLLKSKSIMGLPTVVVADQLAARHKAREKFPDWYHTSGIVYPPTINVEQSSSLPAAKLKADIIRQHLQGALFAAADLTGGFGVDTFVISTLFEKMHYVEPEQYLCLIAQHNHQLLGAKNIYYHTETAEAFINHRHDPLDLVYIDPSRRNETNQKIFRLADGMPDVTRLLPALTGIAQLVMIKTSPLLDIHSAVHELSHIKCVYVISLNNDCKEVIYLCSRHNAVDDYEIHTINQAGSLRQVFSFKPSEEKQLAADFSKPLLYLYEPNTAILKAGAFKLVGHRSGLLKLHTHTHLYTSDALVPDFPGRVFQIVVSVKPDPKQVSQLIPDRKANVITRNYPLTAEALKKACGVTDGGSHYIIGCTSAAGKHVLVAERIQ